MSHQRRGITSSVAFIAVVLLGASILRAQPSGGPYGPVQRTYEIPADAKHVFYAAPDGKADAAGTIEAPLALDAAVTRADTNDVVILRGGVYRTGAIMFNQGITIQPYKDERPILKGTLVADKWTALPNGLWWTSWDKLFPAKPADWWTRQRNGKQTPIYRFNNDMLFIDGKLLHAVGVESQIDENSYVIDYDKKIVYIGTNPAGKAVEITAFDGAFSRTMKDVNGKSNDHKGPTIRGITFTQYPYRAFEVDAKELEAPADPSTFGKDIVGTTIEDCSFTFCSRVAAYLHGDNLVVRNCLISDTRTEGLYVMSCSDALLERNVFMRNNIENWSGYYPAALKMFNQTHHATVRDNLIIDQPNSEGVWFDVGNVDAMFLDNYVENCGGAGLFFEISKGATVAGNVFVNCGEGVRILNSNNVTVAHNTFYNAPATFARNTRSAVNDHFGWHPAAGPDVDQRVGHVFVNNLLAADESLKAPLLRSQQADALNGKLTDQQLKEVDGNVYVRQNDAGPLMLWAPVQTETFKTELKSPAELRQLLPQFESNSRSFDGYYGPLFKSPLLKRFELLESNPVGTTSVKSPARVLELLGWTSQTALTPGAYQVSARGASAMKQ